MARGRRRSLLRRGTAAATVIVVLSGSTWALFSLRGLDDPQPSSGLTELGEITRIPLGAPPQLIAANDHAAWAIASLRQGEGTDADALFRVDRVTGDVRRLDVGAWVMAVGASGDRAWALACVRDAPPTALGSCARAALVELGPGGTEVGRVDVGPASSPTSIAVVGDRVAVWTEDEEGLAVVRGGVVERRIDCCQSLLFAGGFGALWTARGGGMAKVDLATGGQETIEGPEPCSHFGSIAAGEGSVWTTSCDGRVWKVDPATKLVSATVEAGEGEMLGVGDGSVWVGSRSQGNEISIRRIDPQSGAVGPKTTIPGSVGNPSFASKGLAGGDPLFSAIGGGTLWFSNYTEGELVRIDLRSKDEPPPRPAVRHFDMGGRPIRPVVVAYGAAWFTVQYPETGMGLARIDVETGEITRVRAAGHAGFIAAGAGSIWTASCTSAGPDCGNETTIFRIDPTTLDLVATIDLPQAIFGIAFGAGSLWVTTSDGRDGHLRRIDPETNSVSLMIDGWACCQGTAFGEGSLWALGKIGGKFDGELARFDPATEEIHLQPKIRPHYRWGGHRLAVGEGAVWVHATGLGPSALVRIDPATGEITHTNEDLQRWFAWFAVGEGGVWVVRPSETTPCLELVRLDPSDGRSQTVALVAIENEPAYANIGVVGPLLGVGVGGQAAWITIDQSYEVIRVDLDRLDEGPFTDPACTASPSN